MSHIRNRRQSIARRCLAGLLLALVVWHLTVAASLHQRWHQRSRDIGQRAERRQREVGLTSTAGACSREIRLFALTATAELRIVPDERIARDLQWLAAFPVRPRLERLARRCADSLGEKPVIEVCDKTAHRSSASQPSVRRFLQAEFVRAIRVELVTNPGHGLRASGAANAGAAADASPGWTADAEVPVDVVLVSLQRVPAGADAEAGR